MRSTLPSAPLRVFAAGGAAFSIVVLGVAVTKLVGGPQAASASPVAAHGRADTLRRLMRDSVEPPFATLSFHAFHANDISEESLPALKEDADRFLQAVSQISGAPLRSFTRGDRQYFDTQTVEIAAAAMRLREGIAARKPTEVVSAIQRIDTACTSCHTRLAPHLVSGQ